MNSERFGQLSTWILLGLGIYYAFDATLQPRPVLEVLSPIAFLPEKIWQDAQIFVMLRCLSIAFLLTWALNIAVPLSALAASTLLTVLLSVSVAGQVYVKHQPHVVNVLIVLYAFWYLARRNEIAASRRFWIFGRASPFPLRLYQLCAFYLCVSYMFAGLSKVLACGLAWANGTSLQLWCWLSQSHGLVRDICLYDSRLAALLQSIVLIAELTCPIAYFVPRLRVVYGAILLGFHITVEVLFDFGFFGNILSVLLFLIISPVMMAPAEREARQK